MAEQLAAWPRMSYQGPGGKPFLFYIIFGAFSQSPGLSGQEYRSNVEPAHGQPSATHQGQR